MPSAVGQLSAKEAAVRQRLLDAGYHDINQVGRLHVGARVRHVGEQFPRALLDGTATVVALMERTRSPWVAAGFGRRDIELVVRSDQPRLSGSKAGQWADYHTIVIDQPPPTGGPTGRSTCHSKGQEVEACVPIQS